jgi:hypothetical protein
VPCGAHRPAGSGGPVSPITQEDRSTPISAASRNVRPGVTAHRLDPARPPISRFEWLSPRCLDVPTDPWPWP